MEQFRSPQVRARLVRFFHGLTDRALAPVTTSLERLEEQQYRVALEMLRARAARNRASGKPIRVLFLCHLGSVWGKVEPVFRELESDPRFDVDVVGLPYRHSSFGDDEFHDGGVIDFLRDEVGVEPIAAHDAATNSWLDLQALAPDYIFYPTPYENQYPPSYATAVTKYFSRLCYVPYYGTEIMRGEVLEITHPHSFYANLAFAFVSHEEERRVVQRAHGNATGGLVAPIVGAPMLDAIFGPGTSPPSAEAWNFPDASDRVRVLWTPRWRVQEGTCHFPDYSEHLLDFARRHPEMDFVFRPHPLMLENFVANGLMARSAVDDLFARYERTPNARIDVSSAYRDTMLTSDLLISDTSSMMVEYAATGKPVVYTHRVDNFNDFGRELASGFYWVRNQDELDDTLRQLISGDDPMCATRQSVVEKLLGPTNTRVSSRIADMLVERFHD